MHQRFFPKFLLRTALLTVALMAMTFRSSVQAAEDVYQTATRIAERYAEELQELAKWCDEHNLTEEATQTRAWNQIRDPRQVYMAMLPREIGALADSGKDLTGDALEWHTRFRKLREDQANTYFALARRAIRYRQASLAFDLAMGAIHEDPDNEQVRRLLGYRKYKDQWCTAYEVKRYRSGYVDDEQFGWIRKGDLERYRAGQRRIGTRWVSAEEDAKRRQNIENGWEIESEHYVVKTNHSIEEGVRIRHHVEVLYEVWKRLFIRYYATEKQVMQMFEGGGIGNAKMPVHRVVHFRDRDDYNQSLSSLPNIEMSVGLYMDSTKCTYSFAGDDENIQTLYHEATHQLFQESRKVSDKIGAEANFWIVEGLATYMESLRKEKDYYVLGNPDDLRMRAARYRYLNDHFYVPMQELTMLSRTGLQGDTRIRTLYTQIAGMTHFLIGYEGGRYRDALIAYISAVYNGNQDPRLLEKMLGVSYQELDRQYGEFLKKEQD